MRALNWLSFVDDERPEGQQCVGVAIVDAPNFISAVIASHALGINPGGAVVGGAMPTEAARLVKAEDVGRLLSKEEAQAFIELVETAANELEARLDGSERLH